MLSQSPLVMACQWLSRLVWLNLIWCLMTVAGGGILGAFPATVVVCLLARRYLNGAVKATLRDAWQLFKQQFVRANLVGWSIALPSLSVTWYVKWLVMNAEGMMSILALSILPIVLFAAVFTLCCLVQLSIYQTNGVKADLLNGWVLIQQELNVVSVMLLVGLCCVLVALVTPIVTVLVGFIPMLVAAIALLWHQKQELHSLA
ncbi:DUF624 domain-containing protein [Vibrio sp. SCSIO 43136]|uniref:DUF624 domain-containing protein n=1 Tax=Vibrio sp. SCSIO 43136 TaxID=2819101 RepID=UPI002074CCD4|nr:DUF624 domain-containing protein [Vibrio sp. SCSIO 43136]USD67402.1 DUF624 domain-containing protein [Vibrio sp. SCSIO 43136]